MNSLDKHNINILPTIKYFIYTSNNGFKLLLIPNDSATIMSYNMFINIGSLDETDDELGIAHFLEHMMFKGSKLYPGTKLTDTLDNLGASYNASTTYESTNYLIHGLPLYHNTFLEIMLDMYFNPNIPENAVNNERKIILEEYKMRHDNKNYRAYIKFINLITKEKNQLYNRPIIGTIESIKNISVNDLKQFRTKYNDYNKTIMVVSGNFNINSTISFIEKNIRQNIKDNSFKFNISKDKLKELDDNIVNLSFDSIKSHSKDKINISNRLIYSKDIESKQSIIQIIFPSWPDYHKNNLYVSILSAILTDGMSSRITKTLRENNGFSYSQNSGNNLYKPFGFFSIDMGVNTSKMYEAIDIVLNELSIIYNNGVLQSELEKVKNSSLTSIMIVFQKQLSYFNFYTDCVTNGYKIDSFNEIIKEYNDINIPTINNIIKTLINPKNMYITIIGPKEPKNKKIKSIINLFNKKLIK